MVAWARRSVAPGYEPPRGNVIDINDSNPLARGIVDCFPFFSLQWHRHNIARPGGSGPTFTNGYSHTGNAIRINQGATANQGIDLPTLHHTPDEPYTIALGCQGLGDGHGNFDRLLIDANSDQYLRRSGSSILWSGPTLTTTPAWTDFQVRNAVLVSAVDNPSGTGSDAHAAYMSSAGELADLTGLSELSSASLTTTSVRIGNNGALNRDFGGLIHFFVVWGRKLSIDEAREFAVAPYQIYRAQTRTYFIPAAAGGGFQSAWAARSTITISGGMTR